MLTPTGSLFVSTKSMDFVKHEKRDNDQHHRYLLAKQE